MLIEYGGIKMDNNENNQNNGMDYSFDFANQVEEQKPVTPEVVPGNTESVQPQTMEVPVQAEATPVVEPASEAPVENVISEVQPTSTDAVSTGETVQSTETTENVEVESEESEEELIKDKKATKKFLIALAVLILIFIIALPYIQSFIG